MLLFRVLPSLLLKTSKDGECPALVDSLFSCLLAAEEGIFSLYLVWTSPVYIYIVVFPSCATMKSPNLPSGWLHHRYWRALPGPPRSALIRLSKPCILRDPAPNHLTGLCWPCPVSWCTQLYSLTWQISRLSSCLCAVFVHLSRGFSFLKDCPVFSWLCVSAE